MPGIKAFHRWVRIATAMVFLCWARLVVTCVPFEGWRSSLGGIANPDSHTLNEAKRLAADVEWAAVRLPFSTKCLPRAMALSWLLKRLKLGHAVVIAVRPRQLRNSPDALHAWVEVEGERILGDLPGPWNETLRLGL